MNSVHLFILFLLVSSSPIGNLYAEVASCNNDQCKVDIDCGPNGENSQELQETLDKLPSSPEDEIITPNSLQISILGVCKGPFFIKRNAFTGAPLVSAKITISAGFETPPFEVPTCIDNVQNGNEDGVDCGGSCPNQCPLTCQDKIKNGGEEGTDCGGPCAKCPPALQGPDGGGRVLVIDQTVPNTELELSGLQIRGGSGFGNEAISYKQTTGLAPNEIESTINLVVNGGAIYNSGRLTISDCTFENNNVKNTFVNNNTLKGLGGAIYNRNTLDINACQFRNNHAEGDGAAIYNEGSTRIFNSSFLGHLNSNTGDGGVVTNFSFNTFNDYQPLSVIKSTFLDAAQGLAQIKNLAGKAYITNSTLSQTDSTPAGIGVRNFGAVDIFSTSTTRITYSTIANKEIGILNNTVNSQNGGKFNFLADWGFPYPILLSNSIVWGNRNRVTAEIQNCITDLNGDFVTDGPVIGDAWGFGQDNREGASITERTFRIDKIPLDTDPVTFKDVKVETSPCGPTLSDPLRLSPGELKLGKIGNYGGGKEDLELLTIPINPGSRAVYRGDPAICETSSFQSTEFPVQSSDQRSKQRKAQVQIIPTDLAFGCASPENPVDNEPNDDTTNRTEILNYCNNTLRALRDPPLPPLSSACVLDCETRARAKLGHCDIGAFEIERDAVAFGITPAKFYGDSPFIVVGVPESNLTGKEELMDLLTYESKTPEICSVIGNEVSINIVGLCTISGITQNLDATEVTDEAGNIIKVPPFFGSSDDKEIEILPATLTVTAPIASMTYGGTVPDLQPIYVGFKYDDNPSDQSTMNPPNTWVAPTCTTSAAFSPTTPASGSPYTTTCDPTTGGQPNYILEYENGAFTVFRAPLMLTATEGKMTYGDEPPLMIEVENITGFVNDEDESVLRNIRCGWWDGFMVQDFLSTSEAGLYQTACTAEADNYVITEPPIGCAEAPPAENCTFGQVQKKDLVITASDATIVYGEDTPVIVPGYTGRKNNEALDVPPTCFTEVNALSNVGGGPPELDGVLNPDGDYPSTCTGAEDANYNIEYKIGRVKVKPAPLTITASDVQARFGTQAVVEPIYGTVEKGLPGYDGLRNDQRSTATPPNCFSTSEPLSPVDGTYVSRCEDAIDVNYDINYVDGTVVISEGLLTVLSPTFTLFWGEPIPPIIPDYIGLGIADPAGLTLAGCSTTAQDGSPPGEYITTCGGASIDNFIVTHVNGKITIVKSPTTTKLQANKGPVTDDDVPVEISVSVTSNFGFPSGTVVVSARTGESCTAEITNGQGGCEIILKTKALQPITANYLGDQFFQASVSKSILFGVTDPEDTVQANKSASSGCNASNHQGSSTALLMLFGLLFLICRRPKRA